MKYRHMNHDSSFSLVTFLGCAVLVIFCVYSQSWLWTDRFHAPVLWCCRTWTVISSEHWLLTSRDMDTLFAHETAVHIIVIVRMAWGVLSEVWNCTWVVWSAEVLTAAALAMMMMMMIIADVHVTVRKIFYIKMSSWKMSKNVAVLLV